MIAWASSCSSRATALGSPCSYAAMNFLSSAVSAAVASPAVHSARRAGSRSRRVARARWSALFADATLVSSSAAVSFADQPSTSRRTSTARCRAGRCWTAARYASSIVSRSTTTASGPGSSSSRSGYGSSQGRSAAEIGPDRLPGRPELVGQHPPRPAGEDVEAGVRGDPVQPGAHARPALERVPGLPRAQERLLRQVLGVAQRAEHPVAVHLDLPAVPFDERLEVRCVAHPGTLAHPGLGDCCRERNGAGARRTQ